ncbi:MAG: TIM barrel protein [Candidatus Hydrogenedentes bacterium]|nr:TIM barrel protein [Candidatus Hydrogenedentota bacterium]
MHRRDFLIASATVAGVAATPRVYAQPSGAAGSFADLPLNFAVQPQFFPGTLDEQLESAAAWGFPAYAWHNPEGDLDAIRRKADSLGLALCCIRGCGRIEPGFMMDPAQHDAVVDEFRQRIGIAKQLGTRQLIGLTGNARDDISYDEQMDLVVACLKRLAPVAEENDVEIIMEALNPLVDHKGFFLTRTDQTMQILDAVGSPSIKMLFDIYHQQITEGNVIRNIRENIDRIGLFHVADNPGRKEPGTGELNYTNIYKAIHDTGFRGYVELEHGKAGSVEDALNANLACFDWV